MNQLLTMGRTVRAEHGACECRVEKFLGGGGQGEVYQIDLAGKPMALKWYFQQSATDGQRGRLARLVETGPPDDRFLWPVDLASAADVPGFGYLMPLRPSNYKGIVDLMKGRADPSFRALSRAGLQLAHSFLQLHSRGLCYCDISFGNVFFVPKSGDVLICDNDNVTIDGEGDGGVLGTPRFMAPEILRGEVKPSSDTDRYSLAVLLFYMFLIHHPLEGKKESAIRCFDVPAMTKLYGLEPVFIFDPTNDTNRPVKGLHDNALESWEILPRFFQELFERSFTKGLTDPVHGRVRESEWRQGLVRLADAVLYCGGCGAESFYAEETGKAAGPNGACWKCHRDVTPPPRLCIGRSVMMLNADTRLYPHHVEPERLYDFTAPVAEISRHPSDPSIWGLKNLAGSTWMVSRSDGSTQAVETGRSVRLANGLRVQFGRVEGTIQT